MSEFGKMFSDLSQAAERMMAPKNVHVRLQCPDGTSDMRLSSEIIAELAMEARDFGRLEVIAERARFVKEEYDIVQNAIQRRQERFAELLAEHAALTRLPSSVAFWQPAGSLAGIRWRG